MGLLSRVALVAVNLGDHQRSRLARALGRHLGYRTVNFRLIKLPAGVSLAEIRQQLEGFDAVLVEANHPYYDLVRMAVGNCGGDPVEVPLYTFSGNGSNFRKVPPVMVADESFYLPDENSGSLITEAQRESVRSIPIGRF